MQLNVFMSYSGMKHVMFNKTVIMEYVMSHSRKKSLWSKEKLQLNIILASLFLFADFQLF